MGRGTSSSHIDHSGITITRSYVAHRQELYVLLRSTMRVGRQTGIILGRLDLEKSEELRYSIEPDETSVKCSVNFGIVEFEVDFAVCPAYYSYRLSILVVWL